MSRFLQYVYGRLQHTNGAFLGKKEGCIGASSGFPSALSHECHPQKNGLGMENTAHWSTYVWKEQGGFSLVHHNIQGKQWMLLSKVGGVSGTQNAKPYLQIQSNSIASSEALDPLLLPDLIKTLAIRPMDTQNMDLPSITLEPKDGALPSDWLEQVTPFMQCLLSGAPVSWEDHRISLSQVVETIQLVLLCLPAPMLQSMNFRIQSFSLYGEVAIAHGQHARKGVFFMNGSLLAAKKAGVSDCSHYFAKLKSLNPRSKKELHHSITKVFGDLPKSFPLLSWKEQGPIILARLSEKDLFDHVLSILPKQPAEERLLSFKGMRVELLGALLQHKKEPWVFSFFEKTSDWQGAWLEHGMYGMIFAAIPPKTTEEFVRFVKTSLPSHLIFKTQQTLSLWLEIVGPEIWKELVAVEGEFWWQEWKERNEIPLFWHCLDENNPKECQHTLFLRLKKKEWSKKAISKLVAGMPSSLEMVFRMLINQLLSIIPIQAIRLLEEGKNRRIEHPELWEKLYSPSLYMWRRGLDVQRALGKSEETLSPLEIRIILTFWEENFDRTEEISPHVGATAMQYFFRYGKMKSKDYQEIAETVIKERMLWNPDAYFVHSGIPGVRELYLEAINTSKVLPTGGAGALLWMLLKGQDIDDSISLPEGFIDLCVHLSYPIALSQVQSAAVLYALIVHRNVDQRQACTLNQIQRMLFWYVQNKRLDAPLQWTSEPIWRFFPLLHDHLETEYEIKPEEIEFLQTLHPSLLRRYAGLGVLLSKEQIEKIHFRTNHRFQNICTFAHVIVQAKSKIGAINLGSSLWMRLSEENRIKLQDRIKLKTVWWRMVIRYLMRTKIEPLQLKKRSEILEALCMEFNCLSEIVLAAQNGSDSVKDDI